MSAVTPDSSFNTAVSFVTNTNWQGYGGESTMSYLTQMLGLAVQNFLSAATGIAVLLALIRGFRAAGRRSTIGNFWVDLTRSTLYVLLPLSLILALVLVGQGVVQSFRPYQTATLVNPITVAEPVTDAAGNPVKDAQGNPETKRVRIDTQTHSARPGREPDRDQAARHQRRRLLQRQLGAPVRESDAAERFPRGARDPADSGRAVLHASARWSAIAARAGRCSRRCWCCSFRC